MIGKINILIIVKDKNDENIDLLGNNFYTIIRKYLFKI